MYSIKIRDHIMIAHSFNDEYFGIAQNLHGSTYIVDVEFFLLQLDKHNVVIDIGIARDILHRVLEKLNYHDLDKLVQFKDQLTTTEFLSRYIHDEVKKACKVYFNGKIRVTLGESHIAWATYEEDNL